MPSQPNRAQEIFLAAADLADPVDRAAFLNHACGGDSELRKQVESLLAGNPSDGATSAFAPTVDSDRDPGAPAPTSDAPSEFGETADYRDADGNAGALIAGRYVLESKIGEGGMGEVWAARQTQPVKRRVALKLIKAGMDSKAVLARFDAERQALAIMDHPSIAKVLDAGLTPTGHPFFVMELVAGQPLNKFCDEAKLGVRERLELFVPICHAVQHAHHKGIVHRDLKPANILITMIDGRPVPKVIDFGVAKATSGSLTDDALATQFGAVVGTLEYMAPEQAGFSGEDVDTRADVYSLGVILYEMLTGLRPIDAKRLRKAAMTEMIRIIREEEPSKPSTRLSTDESLASTAAVRRIEPSRLMALLRGELDWVVMKCLEKQRDRRYETASGLARDIQHYLNDEPVEARPPSAGYRLKKFIRRNRGPVIAASTVLFALVAGIVGTTVGLFEARRQKGIAEAEWTRADAEQTRANQNFATSRALILDLGSRITQIETGQANPKLADQARKEALDKAREQFERFRADQPDDLAVQMQTAALHRYAANVSRLLNDFKGAAVAYSAAIKIYEDLMARFPDASDYRKELARTLADRSGAEKARGLLKEAAATIEQALNLVEGQQGWMSDSSYHRTLGFLLNDQTDITYRLGHFEDARRFAVQTVGHYDHLKAARATERSALDPLFAAMGVHRMALAQRELGQTTEALASHDDAFARINALLGPQATRDERFWDCEVRRERAWTAATIPARREAAAEDLVKVIGKMEKLVLENPLIAFYQEALAAAHLRNGEILLLLNKPDIAKDAIEKALAVSRVLLDRHGVLSASMLVRGRAFIAMGRTQAASAKNDLATTQYANAVKVFDIALKIDADNFHHRRGRAEAERALRLPVK
jgi:serine/threonine protein kinase/tetratricopeptide (TPR) repeat protein